MKFYFKKLNKIKPQQKLEKRNPQEVISTVNTALCWKEWTGAPAPAYVLIGKLFNFLMPPFLQNDNPAILGRMGEAMWDE